MKRLIVAIIAILYFVISSGVVMNIHYCMGKRSSVKLETFSRKMCGCGMKESKGCCHTELKVVKLEDTHKATYADFFIQIPKTTVTSHLNLIQTPFINVPLTATYSEHGPPMLSAQDTYLQNCVFRI